MIKRLLQEVKEYKKASLLAPLFMAGEVLMQLMLPFLMSFIIDQGVNNKDMAAVVKYGLWMLLCAFISLFCGTMSGKYAAFASAGFVKNLREAMFKNIQSFSFKNIDKYSTSGLVTRMMTDASNVQNAYQMILRLCVRAPLMLIVAICMTFYINARLALIFLIAMVFLGLILTIIILKVFPMFKKIFEKYDDLNASVQENITNIRVVKAYVKEKAETEKVVAAASNLRKMFMKAENIIVLNSPIMQFTMYACILGLSWFGARLIVAGALTTGELMSMFTYAMSILMSLMILAMIFVTLSMSVASAQRIVEILEESSTITNPENPVMEIKDGSIRFNDVSFGYYEGEDKYVLRDINVAIKTGETIGILGLTGSSKTTFTNMIPRLYDVTKGAVEVGGINVKAYDIRALRDAVAVVLQKNVLFSGSILDNLRWGDEQASLEDVKKACKIACAAEFIEALPEQYNSYVEQGGTNFSGGQKQRLCIARALLKKPKVLILDDSTSAVDTRTDSMIRAAFKTSLLNTTKLIISQRISSIEDADRIFVFDEGVITGSGTHHELLKSNTLYQNVYETQKRSEDS